MKSNIKALGCHVIVAVRPFLEPEQGLIALPGTVRESIIESTVVAIGPGVKLPISVGSIVVTAKYGGFDFKLDDQTYKSFAEDEILAVYE